EVWNVVPRIRELLRPQEVALEGLTPRAAKRLAEAALGPATSPEEGARVVQRSEGNPFFVEELSRASADGLEAATVLAVVQSRIQRLEPEARRVLRAASVFGRSFPRDGVGALLGEDASDSDIDGCLAYLEHRELIARDARSKTLSFKHDLLRDA